MKQHYRLGVLFVCEVQVSFQVPAFSGLKKEADKPCGFNPFVNLLTFTPGLSPKLIGHATGAGMELFIWSSTQHLHAHYVSMYDTST